MSSLTFEKVNLAKTMLDSASEELVAEALTVLGARLDAAEDIVKHAVLSRMIDKHEAEIDSWKVAVQMRDGWLDEKNRVLDGMRKTIKHQDDMLDRAVGYIRAWNGGLGAGDARKKLERWANGVDEQAGR